MDPSNRQARLQMRQRGAGTRKIDSVDFGISFDPTPRRSARNTPQQSSQRRRSRTPLTARGAPPRRTSQTPSKNPTQPSTANAVSGNSLKSARSRPNVYEGPLEESETRPRKRQKLSLVNSNAQLATPVASQLPEQGLSGRVSRSRRVSVGLPLQIMEEPNRAGSGFITLNGLATTGGSSEANKENTVPNAQGAKTPRAVSDENTPGPEKTVLSSRQTRSSRSVSQQPDDVSMISITGDIYTDDEVLVGVLKDNQEGSVEDEQGGVSLMTAPDEMPDTSMELLAVLDETTFNGDQVNYSDAFDPILLAEDQAQTLAPRSANIKKKRSSIQTPRPKSTDRRVSRSIVHPSSESSIHPVQSELPTPQQTQTQAQAPAPAPAAPLVHPTSEEIFYLPNNDEEDETYLQPTSPVIPTPKTVTKKPPRKRSATKRPRTSTTSSSGTTQPKHRTGRSTTFPILTHRLTNTSSLPTITEEPEPESEAGEPPDSTPDPSSTTGRRTFSQFTDRPTPNAVDVLAQFCREDVEAALEELSSARSANTNGPPPTTAASLRRNRNAISSFASTLETRLFDLSVAVDYRLALEAQRKLSQKAKQEMQARWMEVRRERERVQVQIEEVRSMREEVEREEERRRGLSELLYRTEVEVERGVIRRGDETGEKGRGGLRVGHVGVAGLEWKVRTVAEKVGATVGAGSGLLERVKALNGVLEGMVGVLERRRCGGGDV